MPVLPLSEMYQAWHVPTRYIRQHSVDGLFVIIVNIGNYSTVKPVLKDHCHDRPPVLTDHIFVANGVVFQDRFYCIVGLYLNELMYCLLLILMWLQHVQGAVTLLISYID